MHLLVILSHRKADRIGGNLPVLTLAAADFFRFCAIGCTFTQPEVPFTGFTMVRNTALQVFPGSYQYGHTPVHRAYHLAAGTAHSVPGLFQNIPSEYHAPVVCSFLLLSTPATGPQTAPFEVF